MQHFTNPAGLSNITGLEVTGGYASPFKLLHDSYFLQAGAGYRLNQFLQFSVSSVQFRNDNVILTDIEGNILDERNMSIKNYTLTLASEPIERLYVGLNMNYFLCDLAFDNPLKTVYFDFGLIRKFILSKNMASKHSASLAVSISNLNSAKASGRALMILILMNRFPLLPDMEQITSFLWIKICYFRILQRSGFLLKQNIRICGIQATTHP